MLDFINLATELGIKGFVHGSEYRAQCPFHNDSRPSFSLNTNSGAWICFRGCGSGEFFGLIERILGCTPQEAREWIASNGSRVGAERLISSVENQLFSQESKSELTSTKDWLAHYKSLSSQYMPQWFLDRGFSWETINRWNIRYSMILDAVTIPVYWQTQLIGTITRNNQVGLPKYQNSPGFPRSLILFGEISTSQTYIMLCEGALDLLWLWQNKYNAIGLLGNDITQYQVEMLVKMRFGEVVLALDNDEGGELGRKRILPLLTKYWMPPQITEIKFPVGKKDPNDCTSEELNQLFEQRITATQFSI